MKNTLDTVVRLLSSVSNVDRPHYGLLDRVVPHVRLSGCGAVTSPTMCWICKVAIGDKWRGGGPCWIVGAEALTDISADARFDAMLGLSLHELSHCIGGGYDYAEPTTFDPSPVMAERRAAIISKSTTRRPDYELEHDPPFIFQYLRMAWELTQRGHNVPLEFCGPLPVTRTAWAYIGKSLAEIVEIWNERVEIPWIKGEH